MEKIVVLNSGGFDSVVLMNDVRGFFAPDSDIYSLHFLYGAPNEKMQKECAKKVCEKVNAHYKEIELPKFEWTKHDFYKGGEDVYVEGRNLVFLSYALSYAESIGAEKIYLATLRMNYYMDSSVPFIVYVDTIASLFNMCVIAPYWDLDKEDLFDLAQRYDVKYDDFFSCDHIIDGKPCHKCSDCVCLDRFYSNSLELSDNY